MILLAIGDLIEVIDAALSLKERIINLIKKPDILKSLIKCIEEALENDPILSRKCDNIPGVAQNVTLKWLNDQEIYEKILEDDIQSLILLLNKKDLLIFPGFSESSVDLESILNCICSAVKNQIAHIIINDEHLYKEYLFRFCQKTTQQNKDIYDVIHESNSRIAELEVKLETKNNLPINITEHENPILLDQIEFLSNERRELLDFEAKSRYDNIKESIRQYNLSSAVENGLKLEQWLNSRGKNLSPEIHGQILLLLADLAIIKERISEDHTANTKDAWRYYREALDLFGPSPIRDDSERLNRIAAKLKYLDGEPLQEVLQRLGDCNCPNCVSMKISFLLSSNMKEELFEILEKLSPSIEWCDYAIAGYIKTGHIEKADQLLEYAKNSGDQVVYKRSNLAYSKELFNTTFIENNQKIGSPIYPHTINESQQENLEKIYNILEPLVYPVIMIGKSSTGIETEGLSLALNVSYLLKKNNPIGIFKALESIRPINLDFARAVLRKEYDCPIELPDLIRKDYSNNFDALLLSTIIEARILDQPKQSIEYLKKLIPQATDNEQRITLIETFYDLSKHTNQDFLDETIEFSKTLLEAEHPFVQILHAEKSIKMGDLRTARRTLISIKDEESPSWLVIWAKAFMEEHKYRYALKPLQKAFSIEPQPYYLRLLVTVAKELNRYDIVIESLESICQIYPDDIYSLQNLALAYWKIVDYNNAIRCFNKLSELNPEDAPTLLNLAQCLALSGKLEQAILILDKICKQENPPIDALLRNAHFLQYDGKPVEAFNLLEKNRLLFWDDPYFLVNYWSLGFAANKEYEAHKAMERIIELQTNGKIDEIFHGIPINELPEQINSWNKVSSDLNNNLVSGRIPWTMVDLRQNILPYLAWGQRTLDGSLSLNHTQNNAMFSIYNTHGFRIKKDKEGTNQLWLIKAAPKNQSIVIDITALITLHRLNLLEKLELYYNEIFIPVIYNEIKFEEQIKYQPHQLSNRIAIQEIINSFDSMEIHSFESELKNEFGQIPYFKEYTNPEENESQTINLEQISRWLYIHGFIEDDTFGQLTEKFKAEKEDDNKKTNKLLDKGIILCDLSALEHAFQAGIYQTMIKAFRVYIKKEQVFYAKKNIGFSNSIASWHKELMQYLCLNNKYKFVELYDSTNKEQDNNNYFRYSSDATKLALQKKLPLLVDDRCLQAAINNSKEIYAFSSNHLIDALAESKLISKEEHANLYLQLIKWKYKFLLPSAGVIVYFASKFKKYPPGKPLKIIARYIHSCMQDLGVFSGFEPTNPPLPMAAKLFFTWHDILTKTAMDIIKSPDFTEEEAKKYIKWLIKVCLPGPPAVLGVPFKINLSNTINKLFLIKMMSQTLHYQDEIKANKTLQIVKKELGISEEEYYEIAAGHLQVLDDSLGSDDDVKIFILRENFLKLIGEADKVPLSLIPICYKLGLIKEKSDFNETDEMDKSFFDKEYLNRIKTSPGPWVFINNNKSDSTEARNITDFLVNDNKNLRNKSLCHIVDEDNNYSILSLEAKRIINEQKDDLNSDDFEKWTPAAYQIYKTIGEDFKYNLCGFIQSLEMNYHEGQSFHWQKLFSPDISLLLSINDDGYYIYHNKENGQRILAELLKDSTSLESFLDEYYNILGHICLTEPLDLGTQLRNYMSNIDKNDISSYWTRLWNWGANNPIKEYHICKAVMLNLDIFPQVNTPEFWERFSENVSINNVSNNKKTRLIYLRADLAAHYLRLLENKNIGIAINRLISLAWWASTKIIDSLYKYIVENEGKIEEWNSFITKISEIKTFEWNLIHPSSTFSYGRYLTLKVKASWNVALLSQLGRYFDNIDINQITTEQKGIIQESYCRSLIQSPIDFNSDINTLWDWDYSLIKSATKFLENISEEELDSRLTEIINLNQNFVSVTNIDEYLTKLPELNPGITLFLCSTIQILSYYNDSMVNIVNSFIENEKIQKIIWKELPLEIFNYLAEGILELQSKLGQDWHWKVPYYWVRAFEDQIENPERARFFLSMVFFSLIIGRTNETLIYLLENKNIVKIKPILREIGLRLNELSKEMDSSFNWRIREILQLLHCYEVI